ncbi:cysteine hydrolase family protein [Pseudoduganella chitinolytica]|uniref:Cysteine hydrolase family protein n=1 Tax=Pseudoduganella chitinolytica TaxID=34070 RepID=A0ABY8B7W3_9BURK|nr:cysteine hydrolase family protein [Pseudoduganella chitinolytica]WEF32025.1 cysteine hydrolase family protein [Pseudoduganella chitinolytica]
MSAAPRRALLVIDVQNEYFTGNLPIEYPPVSTSLPNIVSAMRTADDAGIPVIVVQHDAPAASPVFAQGSAGWQLHDAIAGLPRQHHIHKTMASAFAGTDLAEWLAEHDIDTLTVAGYMMHNCDAATVYEAAHRGLKVEVLADATGALPYANDGGRASAEEIHRVYCTVFHSNFAAVCSTRDWAGAVAGGTALAPDNVYLSNQRARM